MLRRDFLKGAAAVVGGTSLAGAGITAAQAVTNWNWYIYFPSAQLASSRGVQRMIDQIAQKTGADLKIRLHLGGSMPISGSNITQAVQDQVVQIADDGFNEGTIPLAGIMRLPMLFENQAEFDQALEIVRPSLDKAFEDRGVIVLGRYRFPHQTFWGRFQLTSLADLAGKKVRVTSPQQGEFVQSFGAIPVTIAAAEVAPALDRGVVDGVVTASSGGGLLWKDMLKYNYRLPSGYIDSTIIVNKDAFGALTAETQQIVRDAVSEGTRWITDTMDADEDKITQEMGEDGISIIPAKSEDIALAREKMVPIWEKWAAARGDTVVTIVRDVRTKLGR